MLKSNRRASEAEVARRLDRALPAIGTIVVNNVKLKIREYGLIDSGRLVNSITYAVENGIVYIGTNVTYAVFVFLGTIHIAPKNALVEGLVDSKSQIVATFKVAS